MALDLTEEQQKQFGFDPATLTKTTEDAKKKKEDAERAYNEAAVRAKAASAARTQENATVGPIRFRIAKGSRLISGRVQQSVRAGLIVYSGEDEYKEFAKSELAEGRKPKSDNFPNETRPAGSVYVGYCLIEDVPQKATFADGNSISVAGYPSGTYSFENLEGATRTVKKFSANLEAVVAREVKKLP